MRIRTTLARILRIVCLQGRRQHTQPVGVWKRVYYHCHVGQGCRILRACAFYILETCMHVWLCACARVRVSGIAKPRYR